MRYGFDTSLDALQSVISAVCCALGRGGPYETIDSTHDLGAYERWQRQQEGHLVSAAATKLRPESRRIVSFEHFSQPSPPPGVICVPVFFWSPACLVSFFTSAVETCSKDRQSICHFASVTHATPHDLHAGPRKR